MASKRIFLYLSKSTTATILTPTVKTATIVGRARSTLVQPRSSQPQRPSTTISLSSSSSTQTQTQTQTASQRLYSTTSVEPPDYLDVNERKVFDLIKSSLSPTKLEVQDISGGCGSMYGIDIVSEQFKGLTTIKQHRLVNKVLGEEIKKWHGVQLKTKAPE